MKKVCLWGSLVLVLVVGSLCLAFWCLSAGNSVEKHLEKQLGISLPDGANIACTDNHGGFHGDGTLIAVVTFPDEAAQNALWEQIDGKWNELPADEYILEPIQRHWEECAGVLPPLPDAENGRWFYRDRYEEQYGEKCDRNPVLQNCTFALLDRDSGQLYVLENDC